MSNSDDPQTSFTLDPKVIATGFENDGQDVPAAGQIASVTSPNNFINLCLGMPELSIGTPNTSGSCNPAPMGSLPSADRIPTCKFTFPRHLDNISSNRPFTIEISTLNFEPGSQSNLTENYLSAPQQLNLQGLIQGHLAVVIEELSAIDQTVPTDPRKFVFFKIVNGPAQDGLLQADVPDGIPDGAYRLTSMMRTTNSAPVLTPIEMRGSSNDAVYFTASSSGLSDGPPVSGTLGTSSELNSPTPTTSKASSAPSLSHTQVPSNNPAEPSHHHLSAGVVAGIVLAAVCTIAVLIVAIIWLKQRHRFRNQRFLTRDTVSPFRLLEPTTPPALLERSLSLWKKLRSQIHRDPEMIPENNPRTFNQGARRLEPESFGMIPLSRGSADPPMPPPPFSQSQHHGNLREQQTVMDDITLRMFHEFLEARRQGLLPLGPTPPAYSDITLVAQDLNTEQTPSSARVQDQKRL